MRTPNSLRLQQSGQPCCRLPYATIRRTGTESINRVMPLKNMLTPTSVPIAQTALIGQAAHNHRGNHQRHEAVKERPPGAREQPAEDDGDGHARRPRQNRQHTSGDESHTASTIDYVVAL